MSGTAGEIQMQETGNLDLDLKGHLGVTTILHKPVSCVSSDGEKTQLLVNATNGM